MKSGHVHVHIITKETLFLERRAFELWLEKARTKQNFKLLSWNEYWALLQMSGIWRHTVVSAHAQAPIRSQEIGKNQQPMIHPNL